MKEQNVKEQNVGEGRGASSRDPRSFTALLLLRPLKTHRYRHGQQYRCPHRVTTGSRAMS